MIRALIVDDCGAARRMLGRRLERAGFEVFEARDGLAGLQRAVEDGPDLILVRAELGGLDGFDVCARLQAESETRRIPVLVCSVDAENAAAHADRAQRCGAAGHLLLSYSESTDWLHVAGREGGSALWTRERPRERPHGSARSGQSALG